MSRNKIPYWQLLAPRRQASFVAAAAMLLCTLIFMLGYLIGQKHVVDQFVCCLEERSFAEQVYASLHTAGGEYRTQDLVSAGTTTQDVITSSNEVIAENEITPVAAFTDDKHYYAQLIGFRTQQSAYTFADRLRGCGIPVLVRRRISSTARGTERHWYQVVSEPYQDRNELENLVDRVSGKEKLKGVRILPC